MNHYVKLNMDKLETLGKKAAYVRNELEKDLDPWEIKEYTELLKQYDKEIIDTQFQLQEMIDDPWFN
ncbi:hypothetical protein [Aeromonas phage AS-zj]|uniref:Uncharacterized protein n=1 Tax=Aeromonas phage AS-zj TaxID=2024208 RepID=A0A223LDZ7_9CAUD|nr:hypothetical protein HWB28_gp278 [Aeromonas phage AS-zj]ASU00274.1 hypothetical protein [Aeromonas phage AS-zj]